MTPKQWINANTVITHTKDGSTIKKVNPDALKKLSEWETGLGIALERTRNYLATHKVHEVANQYTHNKYIDFHDMNKAISLAEHSSAEDKNSVALTHYQIPHMIKISAVQEQSSQNGPIQQQNSNEYPGIETVLHYKGLDLPLGAVRISTGGSRGNQSKMNTPGQVFGGNMTTAERQSLSMTFGIGPSQGDQPTSQSSGWNNRRKSWSRSSWSNNRRFSNNRGFNNRGNNGGGFNNRGNSGNFSQAGTGFNNNTNNNGFQSQSSYPQNSNNNGFNATPRKTATTSGQSTASSKTQHKSHVKTISKAQYNVLRRLVAKLESTNHQPLSVFVSFIHSMGELDNNIGVIHLPEKNYQNVLNGLKTMMQTSGSKSKSKSASSSKAGNKSKSTKSKSHTTSK